MKEFIFSRNAVYEVLRAGRRDVFRILIAEGAQARGHQDEILAAASARRIPIERVPRARLDKIHANHQGLAAEVSPFSYSDLLDVFDAAKERHEAPFFLVVDSLQDPQNFGTLLRTAEAVGVHGTIIPLAQSVEVTPAVVNASAGATEHMRIVKYNLAQALDAMKAEDVWVLGLDQHSPELDDAGQKHLRGGLALVVGSEGEGMRALVRSKCDVLFRLPMRGRVESLNASVAGSIALYMAHLARRQP